jgi:DNA mismatch endonuclease (patch repair protein)
MSGSARRLRVVDIVSPDTRSRMMSGIKGRDTKPEMTIRRGLHKAGFRYRLHSEQMPGKPDLILPRHRAAVFVNGCFWHGHRCELFKWPATRIDFWRTKIEGNVARDAIAIERLVAAGWRVLTVWECALKGPGRLPPHDTIAKCVFWIRSANRREEIRGLK